MYQTTTKQELISNPNKLQYQKISGQVLNYNTENPKQESHLSKTTKCYSKITQLQQLSETIIMKQLTYTYATIL